MLGVMLVAIAVIAGFMFEGPVTRYVDRSVCKNSSMRFVWCILLVTAMLAVIVIGGAAGIILIISALSG
jgi:hypothetical protein